MRDFDGHRSLDGALVVGLASCAGALASVATLAAACATGLVLSWLARSGRRVVAIAGALAFAIGAARAGAALRAYEVARAPVVARAHGPERVLVTGVVTRSPVFTGDAFRVDVASREGTITLHVSRDAAPPLARGDYVEAIAQLAPLHRFWNEGGGDPRPSQARRGAVLSGGADDVVIRVPGRGLGALIDRLRQHLRRRIFATFPPETAAMSRALVLGEDDLDAADQRAFRRSGLAHLLAVSGMHLVLVVAGFVAALRAFLVRIPALATRVDVLRIAAAIGLPFAWLYADLAGGSGSAKRAAWMTSVVLLAHVLGRRRDPWRAFGLSVLGMIAFDPLVPFDLSFALSAAATFGMLGLSARMARFARGPAGADGVRAGVASRGWGFLIRAIAPSAAASVACAPVLACMTPELPIAGLLANVVAVPLGELLALPLCLAHGLLAPVPAAERGCALAASGALALVRRTAHAFADLPYGTAIVPSPTAWQLAFIAVGAVGGVFTPPKRGRWWCAASLAILVALEHRARSAGAPVGVMRVTFLDVGQGDAALVDLPDGRAIVIDGGGLVGSPVDVGERVIAPVLRGRRRSTVAAAVLSHPHPDHFGGLRTGLARVAVGAFWDTGQGESEGAGGGYAELLRAMRARGVPVLRPDALCGQPAHEWGGARIDVLGPCPSPSPDVGPNDNSFVLRIRFGERAVLFAGDAERLEESALVARDPVALRADVLKVGHHGSRTSSSPAFLAAVRPAVAVVSSGVRNRFGHPTPSTLTALGAAGATVYRTDRDGSITVTTDGRSLDVRTAAE